MLAEAPIHKNIKPKRKGKGPGRPRVNGPMVPNDGLANEREETFVTLVCDGMSLAEAFRVAGFRAGSQMDPTRLWRKEGLQERAKAILRARAATGAVTLPEVTNMLQRVFAGALQACDYSPAHNAAFSLARLYGLVIDRAQVDVLRRPSRDPDAPAEQALSSWVQSLPALPSPQPGGSQGPDLGAPAAPYGGDPEPAAWPGPAEPGSIRRGSSPEVAGLAGLNRGTPSDRSEFSNNFNDLAGIEADGGREFGNGAPASRVTGTPHPGARADHARGFGYAAKYPEVLDLVAEKVTPQPGVVSKRVPPKTKRVPPRRGKKAKKTSRVPVKPSSEGPKAPKKPKKPKVPSFKDLFG